LQSPNSGPDRPERYLETPNWAPNGRNLT